MVAKLIIVGILCALTSLASHMGRAVFHDGVRPIMPEYVEGRMKRGEMASVAFGLSAGFVFSMGFAFTLASKLLNPWLLFLPTDILGVVAPRKWIAVVLGAAWGVGVTVAFDALNTVFGMLPINFLNSLSALSSPVLAGFALFPVLAIFYQFGKVKGIIALILELIVRQLAAMKYVTIHGTPITPEALEMFVGVILLVAFAIAKDVKANKDKTADAEEGESLFEVRTKRIVKSIPLMMVIGGLVSLIANLQWLSGSEVDFQALHTIYQTHNTSQLGTVAFADLIRGLAFIPLIVTTALASGVYGVVGLTLVYPIGFYLAPVIFGEGLMGHIAAFVMGALWLAIEMIVLRGIGKSLERFPSLREASDSIRNAMNNVLEYALLIGSALASLSMTHTPKDPQNFFAFGIFVALYGINEAIGRPVIRLAAAPLAAIITGVLVNIFYVAHLM
ncbi:YhfT family protein [Alicyclobacillus dauci]|uniref:YhfT family protein n=1 Tax=Alicyclobacillus dauci TaxID=1475485 RepID=A0ABY6Z1R6_9BACL|nr:YhfT family protein [Alicyclobacillus dauci]WAH36161.1 YhfT family protein [Alicyclobacillus dauci]